MENNLPALPEGFTLDEPATSNVQTEMPPLPEGFVLDSPEEEQQPSRPQEELPVWAGKNPNLYGAYGAGKAVLENALTPAVESATMALGTLAAPLLPLVGGSIGYGIGKQFMDIVEDYYAQIGGTKPKDRTYAGEITKSAKDTALVLGTGLAFQAAGPVLQKTGKALFEKLPERLYASALKMPLSKKWIKVLPGKTVSARKAATVEGLRSGIRPSEHGLQKIKGLEKEVRGQVDEVVDILSSDPNRQLKVNEVIEKGLKRVYKTAANTEDPAGMKELVDKIAKNFKAHGEYLTPKNANAIKKQLYKEVKWLGAPDQITQEAKKGIAKQIKLMLEKEHPSLRTLNETDASRIYLQEAIEAAVGKNMNKDMVSLGSKVLLSHPKTWPLAFWNATLGHPQVKASLAFSLAKANPGKYSKFAYPEMPLGYVAPKLQKAKGVYRYTPKEEFTKSVAPKPLKTKLHPGEKPLNVKTRIELAKESDLYQQGKQLDSAFEKQAYNASKTGAPLSTPNTVFEKSVAPKPLKTKLHPGEKPTSIRNRLEVAKEKEERLRLQHLEDLFTKKKNIGPPLMRPKKEFIKSTRPLSVNERLKAYDTTKFNAKQKAAFAELKKRGVL